MAPLAFSGSDHPSRIELDVTSNTVTFSGLLGTEKKEIISNLFQEVAKMGLNNAL